MTKAHIDLTTTHCAKRSDREDRYPEPPYYPGGVWLIRHDGPNRAERRRAAAIKRRRSKSRSKR